MYLTVPGGSGFWPAGRGVTIIVNEFVQPYAYVYVMFSPLPTALAYLRIDAWQPSACVRSEAHKENGGCKQSVDQEPWTHIWSTWPSCMQSIGLSICAQKRRGQEGEPHTRPLHHAR